MTRMSGRSASYSCADQGGRNVVRRGRETCCLSLGQGGWGIPHLCGGVFQELVDALPEDVGEIDHARKVREQLQAGTVLEAGRSDVIMHFNSVTCVSTTMERSTTSASSASSRKINACCTTASRTKAAGRGRAAAAECTRTFVRRQCHL